MNDGDKFIDNFMSEIDNHANRNESRNEKVKQKRLYTDRDRRNVQKIILPIIQGKRRKEDVNVEEFVEGWESYQNCIIQDIYNRVDKIEYIEIDHIYTHFTDTLDSWRLNCKSDIEITKEQENEIEKLLHPYKLKPRWNRKIYQMNDGMFQLDLVAMRYEADWHLMVKLLDPEQAIKCPECGSLKCDIERDFTGEKYHHCYECDKDIYKYKMYVI